MRKTFYKVAEGLDPESAFEDLVRSDADIASTGLADDFVVIAKKYSKDAEEAGRKYAEKEGYGKEGEARAIDLGFVRYSVRYPEKIYPDPDKRNLVYQKKYTIMLNGQRISMVAKDQLFDTREEAEQAATEYAMKAGPAINGYTVSVHEKSILISGDDAVSRIRIITKEMETLPDKLPHGAEVTEIHAYAIYGTSMRGSSR